MKQNKRKKWKCNSCGQEYEIVDIYIDEETGEVQPCPNCGENLALYVYKN